MNSKIKKIIAGVVAVILVVIMAVVYANFGEKAVEGSKDITISVINSKQETEKYELSTDAEYLRQAMDEADGLEYTGTESEYGLMISAINGEVAEFNTNNAYWSFYVNGEYCNYGIDTQPVNDGDDFEIVFTKAE